MIDVIIPCYNAEEYIEETIASVLRQTEKQFKITCIDDCSTDGTYSKLMQLSEKYQQVTVLKNDINRGIAFTRNRGIKETDSEYIAFLDDDDIMPSCRLKIEKEYLDSHKEVGVVAGNYLIFDINGNKKVVQKDKFYSADEVRSELPFVNIIPNGTTLIRRSVLEENGIVFIEAYGIEDYMLYSEVSRVTDINILPDVLLEHRVMSTQYSVVCLNSNEKFVKRQEYFDVIHEILIRNITDSLLDKDLAIYKRFLRENVKDICFKEIVSLFIAFRRFKSAVRKARKTDYRTFCKAANAAGFRAVKAYVVEKIRGKNEYK